MTKATPLTRALAMKKPPPDNGVGQVRALPQGQRQDPLPGRFGILDDGLFRRVGNKPGLYRSPYAPAPTKRRGLV